MKTGSDGPADKLEKALAALKVRKATQLYSAESAAESARLAALYKELESLPQGERREVLDAMGLEHVSATPTPITPLRSASTQAPERERQLDAMRMPSPGSMTTSSQWLADSEESSGRTAQTSTPPILQETTDQRCARLLAELEQEEVKVKRGALARVTKRDGRARQTVAADIAKARDQRKEASNPIARMARPGGR